MDIELVPDALRERLGLEATTGLLHLLERAHREGRADLMDASADRYERRLAEEIGAVRVQIAGVEGAIRRDMAEMGASIRQELAELGASIRQEMAEMAASIRQDMARMDADVRRDMASGRVELLRWCFLFWVGQVVVMTSIMSVMFRLYRP